MKLSIVFPALVLAGCASQSGTMQVGTSQSYSSLKDQREAVRAVKVLDVIPPGYKSTGVVDASRCHRNTLDAVPLDDMVLTDMKVVAYGRGADAVTDVQVTRESGLLKNCWLIITARGTMLVKD
ncbi:MAG: hypothetical protein Q7U28_02670 [Aquabacterium sp.]|nr:hypothetical protein [Aquabacterium sp.]